VDLSEQISTAGFEASGTGNMKFTLNGALTIGTLDGANVEIREAVGAENFFLFGLSAEQVPPLRAQYDARRTYEGNAELKQAVDQLASGWFSPGQKDLFWPLVQTLLDKNDYFLVLADYDSYIRCQEEVARAYQDHTTWTRKAILNVARCGRFSSDRSIKQYAEGIWALGAVQ
jgi:starch phosphorylase